MNCKKCDLHKTRHNIIIGRGETPATLLFIGDAPSTSDDLIGNCFVGPVGKFLEEMRNAAGIYSIPSYFTNAVFCKAGGDPTREQILACSQNVYKNIRENVCPEAVILMGDIAKSIFRNAFAKVCCIPHPAILLKHGGKNSMGYSESIIKLQAMRKYL